VRDIGTLPGVRIAAERDVKFHRVVPDHRLILVPDDLTMTVLAARHTHDQEAADNNLGRCYQPERPFCTLVTRFQAGRIHLYTCVCPLKYFFFGVWGFRGGYNFRTMLYTATCGADSHSPPRKS